MKDRYQKNVMLYFSTLVYHAGDPADDQNRKKSWNFRQAISKCSISASFGPLASLEMYVNAEM